eukprot:TRINITY_DN8893_c0_g1_i3.p1 TRINITY_DN8893_c0_g1~~TRINITY_DN8893_c0_g1_i3.p1  ORF type:complete len:245 (+),score=43.53 TRINITY_DN8893_c0_g1_i3:75-809(+)
MTCRLEVKCKATEHGDYLLVTGAAESLGMWDAKRAIPMHTNEKIWPVWEAQVLFSSSNFFLSAQIQSSCADSDTRHPTASAHIAQLPASVPALAPGTEFKIIIKHANHTVAWEPCDGNRVWPSPPVGFQDVLKMTYGNLDLEVARGARCDEYASTASVDGGATELPEDAEEIEPQTSQEIENVQIFLPTQVPVERHAESVEPVVEKPATSKTSSVPAPVLFPRRESCWSGCFGLFGRKPASQRG